jgi:hypothetical protein
MCSFSPSFFDHEWSLPQASDDAAVSDRTKTNAFLNPATKL